ncbi:MAG TPA: methyltransferase domain-containing protein [Herpetosiphonaceae bacterium]
MDLFDILACPTCKVAVERREDTLCCPACRRTYPIVNNIPVMLPDASIPQTQHQHDLNIRRSYDPWLHRVVLQSLPDSAIVLDMGAGNMALNLPNVIRMDVTLTPYVDVVGDTHALPFLPASFDFIFSLAVIEHLRQPFLAAEEMFNALRNGGYVYGECNFVFAYHGYPHHYFNATQQGLESVFAQFARLRSGVAPYQMPSFAVRSLLDSYARDLGHTGEPDVRELQELIGRVLELPLGTYDSRFSEAAALYTAAGTFFFGIKSPQEPSEVIPQVVQAAWHSLPELQAQFPDMLDLGTPRNVLRWAKTDGRRQNEAIERYFAELMPFQKRSDLAVEQGHALPDDWPEAIFTHIPEPEREQRIGDRQRALQQRIDALEAMIAHKDRHILQLERLIRQIAAGRLLRALQFVQELRGSRRRRIQQ